MTETKNVKENELQSQQLCEVIINSIQETKGQKIVQLDLREIPEAPADFFIVCNGQSNTQVKAISNNLLKTLKTDYGIFPNHVEGQAASQWILVDFFDVVVHIFYPEARAFYDIENLWGDSKVKNFE